MKMKTIMKNRSNNRQDTKKPCRRHSMLNPKIVIVRSDLYALSNT